MNHDIMPKFRQQQSLQHPTRLPQLLPIGLGLSFAVNWNSSETKIEYLGKIPIAAMAKKELPEVLAYVSEW